MVSGWRLHILIVVHCFSTRLRLVEMMNMFFPDWLKRTLCHSLKVRYPGFVMFDFRRHSPTGRLQQRWSMDWFKGKITGKPHI